jgi:hypothetical protein
VRLFLWDRRQKQGNCLSANGYIYICCSGYEGNGLGAALRWTILITLSAGIADSFIFSFLILPA